MFGVNVVTAETPAKSPLAYWASLYCRERIERLAARPRHRSRRG